MFNELPEVETIRAALSRDIVGKKLKTVAVTTGKTVRRHKTVKDFRELAEGRTIKSIGRLGTNIIFVLDDGSRLVAELGTGGHFQRTKGPKKVKAKHTHVVITLNQGGELRFIDETSKGELFVSPPAPEDRVVEVSKYARLSVGGDGLAIRQAVPELAHLGLDVLEDQVGWDRMAAILRSSDLGVKELLLTPEIMAGLGSLYVDEILYNSGIRHDRISDSLSTIEIRRLHRGITEIIADAIKHHGSSFGPTPFADPDGKQGDFQQSLHVHAREGLPCGQCRAPIERVSVRQVTTYFCPKCQN